MQEAVVKNHEDMRWRERNASPGRKASERGTPKMMEKDDAIKCIAI